MSHWTPRMGPDRHRRTIEERFGTEHGPLDLRDVDHTLLVCFTNRSGSTLMAELLASTGRVGRAREYFNHPMVVRRSDEHGITSFEGYIAHLADTFAAGGVLAMKVGLGQLCLLAESGMLDQMPSPSFVHTERRDLLAQAVSWEIARQSGRWTSRQEAEGHAVYDFAAIDARIDAIVRENGAFRRFFAKNGLGFAPAVYEDVVADPARAVESVARAMGVPLPPPDPSKVPIERQASEVNQAWIERYLADRSTTPPGGAPEDGLLEENAALRLALEGEVDPRLFGRPPSRPPRGLRAAAKALIPERFHPALARAKRSLTK